MTIAANRLASLGTHNGTVGVEIADNGGRALTFRNRAYAVACILWAGYSRIDHRSVWVKHDQGSTHHGSIFRCSLPFGRACSRHIQQLTPYTRHRSCHRDSPVEGRLGYRYHSQKTRPIGRNKSPMRGNLQGSRSCWGYFGRAVRARAVQRNRFDVW